ncbi:hypothetical protein ACFQ3Z_04640 [Streptomyces nogalater]
MRALLERHHQDLRDALHAALVAAEELGQLAPGVDPGPPRTCWPCSPTA